MSYEAGQCEAIFGQPRMISIWHLCSVLDPHVWNIILSSLSVSSPNSRAVFSTTETSNTPSLFRMAHRVYAQSLCHGLCVKSRDGIIYTWHILVALQIAANWDMIP